MGLTAAPRRRQLIGMSYAAEQALRLAQGVSHLNSGLNDYPPNEQTSRRAWFLMGLKISERQIWARKTTLPDDLHCAAPRASV